MDSPTLSLFFNFHRLLKTRRRFEEFLILFQLFFRYLDRG